MKVRILLDENKARTIIITSGGHLRAVSLLAAGVSPEKVGAEVRRLLAEADQSESPA